MEGKPNDTREKAQMHLVVVVQVQTAKSCRRCHRPFKIVIFNDNMHFETPAKEVGPRMIRTTRSKPLQTVCVDNKATIGTHKLHFILMYRESEIQLRIARSTRSTRRIPRTRCSLRRGSRTCGSCVTDGQRRGGPGSTLAFADAVGVLGSVAFPTGGARGARGGVLRSGRVVF